MLKGLLILLCSAGIALAGDPPELSKVKQLYSTGREALLRRDYKTAFENLREAVELSTNFTSSGVAFRAVEAREGLAQIYLEHGQYSEAIELYKDALRRWTDAYPEQRTHRAALTLYLATAYGYFHKYDEARSVMNAMLAEPKDHSVTETRMDAVAWQKLGEIEAEQDHLDAAKKYLLDAEKVLQSTEHRTEMEAHGQPLSYYYERNDIAFSSVETSSRMCFFE